MRLLLIIFAVVGVMSPNLATAAECNGRVVPKTGPNGKTINTCLDGKYSTCMRDAQALGWGFDAAKRNCDRIKAEGRIR